jgi:REP element-mobilizing transposase RayT
MPRPKRSEIFDHTVQGVYHATQRVVRRARLCGYDKLTRRSFEHRRGWIRARLAFLASVFAFEIRHYAVMPNHAHVIVANRPDILATWTAKEVAQRWLRLYPKRRNSDGSPAEPTAAEIKPLLQPKKNAEYRRRLGDISWLMKSLFEVIARRSNAEDKCTGHFWEGRFKLQKLADEIGCLACGMYVDLNPIRAGLAKTPEESQYTSVYDRIAAHREAMGITLKPPAHKKRNRAERRRAERLEQLEQDRIQQGVRRDAFLSPLGLDERAASYAGPMPNKEGLRVSDRGCLAISLEQYLVLLDWTGRQLRHDGKRGQIPPQCKPILERIGMTGDGWVELMTGFETIFKQMVGRRETLRKEAAAKGRCWYQTSGLPLELEAAAPQPAAVKPETPSIPRKSAKQKPRPVLAQV